MTTKYTPAPWTYNTDSPNGCPVVVGPGKVGLAMLWHTVAHPAQAEIAHANAALIAAAPEMIDALEELVDLIDDIVTGDYKPDHFTCQPARNIIAKAKGQAE